MPNRYEREIEEILRNLEQTDPKARVGQKFGGRLRRKPAPRVRPRQRSNFSLRLTPDWLLVVTIGVALIAGGYAYITGPNVVTGFLAIVSFICVLLVAFSQFVFRPRRQSARYGNVTITPLRRGPINGLKTQWNLFMLKIRYRRRKR